MNKLTKEKLDQVLGYRFLENAGKEISDAVCQATSWPDAIRHSKSSAWKRCLLMTTNCLSRKAHEANWHRGHEWNTIGLELSPVIDSWLQTSLNPVTRKLGLPKTVADTLSWTVVHICFEVEYQDILKPLFYLPLIDPWLQRGYFPCGWIGEKFPDGWDGVLPKGKLVVF